MTRPGWKTHEGQLSTAAHGALGYLALEAGAPTALRIAAVAGIVTLNLGYATLRWASKHPFASAAPLLCLMAGRLGSALASQRSRSGKASPTT